jgi:hypothetical protein
MDRVEYVKTREGELVVRAVKLRAVNKDAIKLWRCEENSRGSSVY